MNYIFFILISVSILIGFANNTLENVVKAMFDGCELAVKISFSLIGIMAFWLGIMKIAEKSGLITFISKIIFPLLKPLFKDTERDSQVLGNITTSISANALGLTNAATPIGLKVMKKWKMWWTLSNLTNGYPKGEMSSKKNILMTITMKKKILNYT